MLRCSRGFVDCAHILISNFVRSEKGQAMAKQSTEFAEHGAERTMQAANLGFEWFREVAERNLNQSRVAVEELLSVSRRLAHDLDSQTSAIREHSLSLAAETLQNAFEFGSKLVRLREPQDFAQVHSEFVSRQAQTVADRTRELNERFVKGAEEFASVATSAAESARRQSKAA